MKNKNQSVNKIVSDKNLMKAFVFAADRDAFLHEHDCFYGEHDFLMHMFSMDCQPLSDESMDNVAGGVGMTQQQIIGMLQNIGSENGYDESTMKQLIAIALGSNGVV